VTTTYDIGATDPTRPAIGASWIYLIDPADDTVTAHSDDDPAGVHQLGRPPDQNDEPAAPGPAPRPVPRQARPGRATTARARRTRHLGIGHLGTGRRRPG
jgi:hypothetical protein